MRWKFIWLLSIISLQSVASWSNTAAAKMVMQRYFSAVSSHSVEQILDVFSPSASIKTASSQYVGHEQIRQFYLGGILKCREFYPQPGQLYFASPNMVAVEIVLNCDGVKKAVGDFFTIDGEKIIEMTVYSGPGYLPN